MQVWHRNAGFNTTSELNVSLTGVKSRVYNDDNLGLSACEKPYCIMLWFRVEHNFFSCFTTDFCFVTVSYTKAYGDIRFMLLRKLIAHQYVILWIGNIGPIVSKPFEINVASRTGTGNIQTLFYRQESLSSLLKIKKKKKMFYKQDGPSGARNLAFSRMGLLLKSIYLMKLWGQTCESVWTQKGTKCQAQSWWLPLSSVSSCSSSAAIIRHGPERGEASTSQGVAWFNQLASVQHYGMTHVPRDIIHSCWWALVELLGYGCHKKEMEQKYSCVTGICIGTNIEYHFEVVLQWQEWSKHF